MPKIAKETGPSLTDGSRPPRVVDRVTGTDIDVASDVNVGGTLRIGGFVFGALTTHDWTRSGWVGFTPVPITADGSQAFAATVSSGKGVVTGSVAGAPNHRVAYLRDHTEAADSVVTSVIHGPTADWDGSNAQQGHLHRAREITSGQWEGIAVWTSVVFGADYSFLHCNSVRWNGTTLLQGTAPVGTFGDADSAYIDRRLQVIGVQRLQPLLWVNDYRVARPQLASVTTTDLVAAAGFADTTFNVASVAIQSVPDAPAGVIRVIDGVNTSAVAYTPTKVGYLTPTGVDSQKRWTSFHLSTRVVGGTTTSVTVEAKRWRPDEPEPDWSDPRVQRGAITPSATVPALAVGAGRSGLWAAHFHDSSGGAWGNVRIERV